MKTFVRVFIILGAIGAMVSVALPALAGVAPPAEDALCLADCADAFGECKSACGMTCTDPQCVPGECSDMCINDLVDCVAIFCEFVPRPRCGDNNIDPGEQCDPPGMLCSGIRVCNINCRCVPVQGGD